MPMQTSQYGYIGSCAIQPVSLLYVDWTLYLPYVLQVRIDANGNGLPIDPYCSARLQGPR
jgi:hypothetical protein